MQNKVFVLSNNNIDGFSEFFQGYAFVSGALVFEKEGYDKFKLERGSIFSNTIEDGAFLAVEKNGDDVVASLDPMGMNPLYYYFSAEDQRWVIGNSLLECVKELRLIGAEVKLYEPALANFKLGRFGVVGGQLASHRTPVQDVFVLEPGKGLVITKESEGYSFSKFSIIAKNVDHSYASTLKEFCASAISKLKAFDNIELQKVLSLSGGVDSRCLLSLINHNSDLNKSSWSSYSAIFNEVEYAIAEKLANKADLRLFPRFPAGPGEYLEFRESYNLAMQAYAGVKTNFSVRTRFPNRRKLLCIGGSPVDSVTLEKSYYQYRSFLETRYGFVGNIVADEIKDYLELVGIDPNDEKAMLYFYSGLRSRYHYGVYWYKSLGSIQYHPLMSPDYLFAAKLLSAKSLSMNDLERDLISLMDEGLLSVPFESEGKVRGGSMFRKEKFSEHIRDYKVYCGLGYRDRSFEGIGFLQDGGESVRSQEKTNFLMSKLEMIREACGDLSFDDAYWKRAKSEVASGGDLKCAGVILGVGELFL